MTVPDQRPPKSAAESLHSRGDYSLHPLAALDGVLIYAALHGESVGYFFGRTEEEAAEAVAADVLQHISPEPSGSS